MEFPQTGWTSVVTNPKTFCFKSQLKENLQNFQKFIFHLKMILWKHRVQSSILISLPQSFSPSTVNIRSKFWRIWKKKPKFQKLFFHSKSSSFHVECSFIKHIKNFPPNFKNIFFSIYFTSNTNISKRVFK